MMKSRNPNKPRVLLCGACMSGNMGGQALYISMVDSLEELIGDIEITVLSKYPLDDAAACQQMGWNMIAFPTRMQILYGVPFFLVAGFLRLLKLPWKWAVKGPINAYIYNDLLVDLSGISFTDDRNLSGLIINSLWLLPAVQADLPYVKASQAMGPFSKLTVKLLSKYFLSRAAAVVARGAISYHYLGKLLPDRTIYELPDVAFLLKPAADEEINQILVSFGFNNDQSYCVVGPSSVVEGLMNNADQIKLYPQIMAAITDELTRLSGLPVLLIPHERAHSDSTTDDLNICRDTYSYLSRPENVVILDGDYSARILKGIIARAEIAVGSRFHFMVAAMSSGVPGIAIAWSHKYYEMMDMFGQGDFVVDFQRLSINEVLKMVLSLWNNRQELREEMAIRLPQIMNNSRMNAIIIKELLDAKKKL